MTGGGSGNAEAKALQFNQAQYQQLKQERATLQLELEALPTESDCRLKQARYLSEANALRSRVQVLEKELNSWQELRGHSQRLEPLLEQQESITAKMTELKEEIRVRQEKIDELEERIDKFVDSAYEDLGKEVGVDNLRVYLRDNAAEVDKKRADGKDNVMKITKLRSQLGYYQGQDPTARLATLEATLTKSQGRLAELEQEAEKVHSATAALQEKAKNEAADLEALKQRIKAIEDEQKDLSSQESQQVAAGKKVHSETKRLEAALEAIAMKQSEILKTAQLEQVSLPRHEGEEAEPMETDNAAEDAANLVASLNFDSLSRQQKAATDEAQREKLDSEFTTSIEEQQAALVKVLPNLKAVEQYEEAKEKDDKEKAELEEARQANKETANAFHEARQQRADMYMKAFEHIKDVINPIYKDLTKSSAHPMGGTAYLSMVNSEEEPFLSGVSFTAMPPSKRWRQMEALSGGEKTVAALALLFAIQSFHPSPFFVLDEVDAALDASNVAKVANYIREKTRTEEGLEQFQAIVISLKDYFFSKADAIVGVTKHPEHGCSQTFTLDLNQFGQPEQ